MTDPKHPDYTISPFAPAPIPSDELNNEKPRDAEALEIFQRNGNGVDFRTVSWQRAVVVFLKINFAMSILSTPDAIARLGAVGGGVSLVAWIALNTYTAVLLGGFRGNHPECHMLADMMGYIWGRIGRELVGVQIVVAQILISAGGIVSTSTALNALSEHGACTVVFALVAAVTITLCSSIRTFSRLGWLTWFGFFTFFAAIFIFTVAVARQDRPAAAPPTGAFELGFTAIASPTFVVGMVATANLFICTSGSSMFLPVISEMRRPSEYRKAVLWAGGLVGIMYVAFSMVIYRYCGVWLSVPALDSAGPLFKKISYGFLLPGLIIGVGIYQHVAAKYVFVRLLRDSKHLQANTAVHWSTWLSINIVLGVLGLVYPALLWMYDFRAYRSGSLGQRAKFWFHGLICLLGLYMIIGGTYAVAVSIRDAFASGFIARTFDCADNSNSGKVTA
ncbi:transmembrane amino acid transporter [Stagonosporopsis vannaccii]|nr:transmembrane amino acid transporter [Stagonosporopsis vannaccii]